jgi:hypothetical protein
MLKGENGYIVAKAMKLIVKLGEIYGANKLIKITSCQAAGVSYKSIGEHGLEFLKGLAEEGAKVKVPTFLNPAGMDIENWKEFGISEDFAEKQKEIIEIFKKMDVIIACSCTPYLIGNLPHYGEHLAWSESSAVSFANSVIGARTNRESALSALASAITGRTPNYGLHLEESRGPNFLVKVKTKLKTNSDFGALGYFVGKIVKNKIPYFSGIENCSTDNLKSLGAAMAASGAVALYHVENKTPEAKKYEIKNLETIEFSDEDLKKSYSELSDHNEPDLIAIGCPHASISEIEVLAKKLKGKKLNKEFWIYTSKSTKIWADKMGYTKIIEEAGAKILCDTCMVVSPLEELDFNCIGTDSGKAAKYLPSFCKKNVFFSDLDSLINKALENENNKG